MNNDTQGPPLATASETGHALGVCCYEGAFDRRLRLIKAAKAPVAPFEFDVGEQVMLLERRDSKKSPIWGPYLITKRAHVGSIPSGQSRQESRREFYLADLPPAFPDENRYRLSSRDGAYACIGWFRESALVRSVLRQLVHVMRKGGDSRG